MSMLDAFFSKGFKGAKCKTLLKLTILRIKLLRNRREIELKQMRRDIAKLPENGQEATARIRVEHIIREENMMATQEMIELFRELIVVRLPIIETQRQPFVTGTSVLGMKYKDGVILAADMGGSYGSTLRYKSVERIKPIGKHSLLGASGEISDFLEILRYLDELILYDNIWDDGNSLGPKEVDNYLSRVMYNRRNKFNPLWNSLVLGGVKNGQKYLGVVGMIGTQYEDNHVATGYGNHLARPILRSEWREELTYEEAVKLLEKCLLVLLYRDRSSINKFQIAKITDEGVTISQPYSLKTFWNFSSFENPSKGAEGSW